MKTEFEIKNKMIGLIEYLKDSFEQEDLDYMNITEIKLCQEEHTWGEYGPEVITLMGKIRLLAVILEIEYNELENIFDGIKRRDDGVKE